MSGQHRYDAIASIHNEYKRRLKAAFAKIKELKDGQRQLAGWIKQAGLSKVNIPVPEPHSSGYRHTILDIHSPTEAYIFFSDGGYRFVLIGSVFEDDFGDKSDNRWVDEILYTYAGILKIDPTPRNIQKIKKNYNTDGKPCAHGRMEQSLST